MPPPLSPSHLLIGQILVETPQSLVFQVSSNNFNICTIKVTVLTIIHTMASVKVGSTCAGGLVDPWVYFISVRSPTCWPCHFYANARTYASDTTIHNPYSQSMYSVRRG